MGELSGERVQGAWSHNFTIGDDLGLCMKEAEALQALNQRVRSDKTYHLVLSFREHDEVLSREVREIEDYFCQKLGFLGHQRISVLHGDTDNLHLHIAVNKIHPETLTIHNPFQDKKRMQEMCREMERRYGLEKEPVREKKVHEMARYGMESFEDWVKKHAKESLLEGVKEAKSWDELQAVAAKFDIEFRRSGAGMAISHRCESLYIKSSSVDRGLSFKKLTEKFGEFIESSKGQGVEAKMSYQKSPLRQESKGLWSEYLSYKSDLKGKRSERVEVIKSDFLRQKNEMSEKMRSKKILLKINHPSDWREQKAQRSILSAEAVLAKQSISKWYREERGKITKDYSSLSWEEWLVKRGERGDLEAIKALRRVKKKELKAKNDEVILYSYSPRNYLAKVSYSIKGNGDVHYQVGNSEVIDVGDGLIVKAGASEEAIKFSVELARNRFGGSLLVKGEGELCRRIKEEIGRGKDRGMSR